jgi:hypothetical protein
MSSHTGDAPWNSSLEGKTTSKPTWRNFGCHGWYFDELGCSLFMKCVFLCNFHLVDHKLLTTFLICSKSICLILPIISQNLWTLERLKNQKIWGRVVSWQGNQETNFPPCQMNLKPTFWIELGEWEKLQNSFHHHCSFEHEAPYPITLLENRSSCWTWKRKIIMTSHLPSLLL